MTRLVNGLLLIMLTLKIKISYQITTLMSHLQLSFKKMDKTHKVKVKYLVMLTLKVLSTQIKCAYINLLMKDLMPLDICVLGTCHLQWPPKLQELLKQMVLSDQALILMNFHMSINCLTRVKLKLRKQVLTTKTQKILLPFQLFHLGTMITHKLKMEQMELIITPTSDSTIGQCLWTMFSTEIAKLDKDYKAKWQLQILGILLSKFQLKNLERSQI